MLLFSSAKKPEDVRIQLLADSLSRGKQDSLGTDSSDASSQTGSSLKPVSKTLPVASGWGAHSCLCIQGRHSCLCLCLLCQLTCGREFIPASASSPLLLPSPWVTCGLTAGRIALGWHLRVLWELLSCKASRGLCCYSTACLG